MSLPVNFQKTLAEKPDAGLFKMFESAADYTPEALDAALEEIKRRGLPAEQALKQKSLSTLRAASQTGYCKPTLIRINGCGFTTIGKSDLRADGSFISTVWFTFIFLPIIPFRSERIQRVSSTSYHVIERLKLNISQVIYAYLYTLAVVSFLFSSFLVLAISTEQKQDTSALVALVCSIVVFLLSVIFIIKRPRK